MSCTHNVSCLSPTEIEIFIFYNFLSSFSFIISLQRAMICNVRKSTKFGDFSSHTMALNTGHSLHEHLVTPLSSSHDHMQSELPINGLPHIIRDFGVGMEWNKLSKIGRRFSWCFEHRIRGLVGFKICALQSQYRFQLLRVLENPNLLHESHVTIWLRLSNCCKIVWMHYYNPQLILLSHANYSTLDWWKTLSTSYNYSHLHWFLNWV